MGQVPRQARGRSPGRQPVEPGTNASPPAGAAGRLEGGGCAVVQKVHHVLTDGVGGLAFLVGPLLALSRAEARAAGAATLPPRAAGP